MIRFISNLIMAFVLILSHPIKAQDNSNAERSNEQYSISDETIICELKKICKTEFIGVISSGITCIFFYAEDQVCKDIEQDILIVWDDLKADVRFCKILYESIDHELIDGFVPQRPSVIIYKDGKEKAGIIGEITKDNLEKLISRVCNVFLDNTSSSI